MGYSVDAFIYFGFESQVEYDEFRYGDGPHASVFKILCENEQSSDYPVKLLESHTAEYPIVHFAVPGTVRKSTFNPRGLVVNLDNVKKFKQWCEDHGIKYEKPEWHVAGLWW